MKILIAPGEQLEIRFADENGFPLDGEFTVFFDTKKHPNKLILQETAGLPGNVKGKADEISCEEDFTPDGRKEGPVQCPHMKK